ncbi:MAG: methionine--tRNA ligase [Alphaproteobacteria bacterium]|nr:methionine--tRNA ligase [Alphaproteobacteria bacterium]
MSQTNNSFYITTPIYYVNDTPHIGHAYTTLACDVLARFARLDGKDVRFATGTDEHGQKVQKSAELAGIDPQTFTDKVSKNFRDLADTLNFSYDDFIRTTELRHQKACQTLWQKLKSNDQIYLDSYKGWYAIRDEAFYDESELRLNAEGKKIAPSGAEVQWLEEPSYFFKLSNWQKPLLDFYKENPDFIAPTSRRNEVIKFVEKGLQDLSISRVTFKWGIPVPDDQQHIMYVWLDALTNYLTVAGYPEIKNPDFKKFWPATLHMIGKDILRFHAVYWPAFLMAAQLPLPKRVFAHGWWTNEGEKISKSLGNVINPFNLVEKYGLDQTRYFLLREVPFGNDGDFSHQAILNRSNSELANDLGNLAQRVLSIINKNCNGVVPECEQKLESDNDLLNLSEQLLNNVRKELLINQAFHKSLESIFAVVGAANRYVDTQAPWNLRKNDLNRFHTVLYTLVEVIRRLGIIIQPFIPQSANLLLDQVGQEKNERNFNFFHIPIKSGIILPKPMPIFPKILLEE